MNTKMMTTHEIREARLKKAMNRCEYCGSRGNLEMHHIIDADGKRRKKHESFFTVVMLCPECHRGERKYKVIPHFREKLDNFFIQNGLSVEEIIAITGRGYKGD